MKILVINCGSSSLKYQLFDMEGEKVLAKGICESIATDMSHTKGSTFDGRSFDAYVNIPDHTSIYTFKK